MAGHARTWKQVHRLYERLRQQFFMDAAPPLRIPPPATEIRWYWLPSGSGLWGCTYFDHEKDPDAIGLCEDLRHSRKFMRLILLHEMTHIRNPKLGCWHTSRAWKAETLRLAQLGAPIL